MLSALFSKVGRWLKPDGVRAPGIREAKYSWSGTPDSEHLIVMRDGEPVPCIVEGYVMMPMPIPPESCLLEMAYFAREKNGPVAIQMTHEITADFIDQMLEALRADTPGQHETPEPSKV